MRFVLDCVKLLAYCALIVLLGEAAWTLHVLRPKSLQVLTDLNRATIAAGAAAGNVEKASRAWQKASELQASESTAVLTATKDSLASMQMDVKSVAASANSLLLLTSKAIDHQDQSLLETQSALRESLTGMNQATVALQKDLDSADKILSSPELQKSLVSLNESAQHTSEATANLAATTKDVQQVADAFRSDYLKPKNRALAYLKAILGLGSQGRILFNK